MTILQSFSYKSFVTFHGKKIGSHNMTVISKSVLQRVVLYTQQKKKHTT